MHYTKQRYGKATESKCHLPAMSGNIFSMSFEKAGVLICLLSGAPGHWLLPGQPRGPDTGLLDGYCCPYTSLSRKNCQRATFVLTPHLLILVIPAALAYEVPSSLSSLWIPVGSMSIKGSISEQFTDDWVDIQPRTPRKALCPQREARGEGFS